MTKDNDLLEKYNTPWDKVSANIKKQCDSKPAYNKNFLKTDIKSHGHEVTDFYDKEIPKLDSNHICLAVTSLNSALDKDVNYYPQVFSKECKYINKKVIRNIIDDLEGSSNDSDDSEDSQEELIKATKLMFLEKTILKI